MDDMKKVVLCAKATRLFCDCTLLVLEYGDDDDIGLKELSDAVEAFQTRVNVAVQAMKEVVNG